MSSQSINTNRRRSQFRGGETRIMKRALSSLLVFALVLTLLVPAFAFAADKTTEQKFNELKEKGLLNGVEDGSAALDRELTRAELAAILVRLFKLEPITGQSTFIDVPANHWAQKEGVIEAVAKAGLMGSTTTYSKTFSPDAKLTIAEVAKVAVSALGLTVDQNAKIDGVQPWAAPYVDAALKAGLIAQAKDYHANANRGILVDAAYSIYLAKLQPPVTDATKVESVSADNLLQVKIKFDGKVDEFTASDATNYTINNGVEVKGATLSEDGKVVTLTLDTADGKHLKNQVEYKLSFNGVKAGSNTLSLSAYAFTPVDNSLPEVTKVEALGNKTVKLTFSEPVKRPNISAFLIDGKQVLGPTPDVSTNVVIVKAFSAFNEGEHKIKVNAVEDYAGFKSLSSEHSFAVVLDSEAPTISEVVSATFEQVTLKFSEPVDPQTVNGNNVYWMVGSSKKPAAATPTQVSDDTFTFDFTNNRIQYTTDLYVTGVKDYSGNQIAKDSKVQVNPTLDQSRPEVLKVDVESASEIYVKFNKRVDENSATNIKNYVFKNAKGEEVNTSIGSKAASLYDARTVKITLAKELTEGQYTLEISGVQDATFLKNVMLPYSTKIEIGDDTNPTVEGNVIRKDDQKLLVVTFSEPMDLGGDGSVVDRTKYLYHVANTADASVTKGWKQLPSSALLNVSSDASVVYISLPSLDKDKEFKHIDKLRIQLVKDQAGNYLEGLVQEPDVKEPTSATTVVQSVYAYSNTQIRVTFDANILSDSLVARDFQVIANGGQLNVVGASVTNGNIVVLTLAEEHALNDDGTFGTAATNVLVNIVPNPSTSTADGRLVANNVGPATVGDKIKASVKSFRQVGNVLEIQFNEELGDVIPTDAEKDLAIYVNGTRVTSGYNVSVARDTVSITFTTNVAGKTVKVDANAPAYIKDVAGNAVAKFSGEVYFTN